jgi:hypothetical protein
VLAEAEAIKPMEKNPLDLLPPSKMIFDEWRGYIRTQTNFREVAIKDTTFIVPFISLFCCNC